MLVTLVALLCNTQPGPPLCLEEIVVDQALDMQTCQIQGQIGIAQWMAQSKYRTNWRLDRYKCVPGHYEIRGAV